MRLRIGLPAAVLIALSAFALMSTAASAKLMLGLGDESATVFSDPHFQALGVKRTRYITPYDAALKQPSQMRTDAWMAAARAAHEQIVVAFNPGTGQQCPNAPCSAPSASQYKTAFLAFHARYPYVKIYQPWNEVNSTTQPTFSKPQAVVTYYSIVKKYCKGCTVLGADIEDLTTPHQANYVVYIGKLLADFKKAHVATPHVWGIHNYEDVNYFHATNTAKMLKLLPGQIWMTETGGLAYFETGALKVLLPYNVTRQDKAIHWMMTLALRYPKRIARVYIYNFFYAAQQRFDSALLGPGFAPRPAYLALYYHYRSYFK